MAVSHSQATAMAKTGGRLLEWTQGPFDGFAARNQVGRHRLEDLDLFSDDKLIDLLDSYPRNRLQAWTMGTDPCRREEWTAVDTADVSGKDLLAAAKKGRLWYNILRLDLFDRKYKEVVDQLYAEMSSDSPGFEVLSAVGTLLLSSPHAQVYYHADGPPTTLFHVRGEKRMWLYPAGDERFVSQFFMEEIFGSAMDEEVPYSPEYDKHAEVFDLKPGDAIWWPQNAPHRIVNGDSLNVSLSTRYQTTQSEQRKLVYNTNRFLRRTLGLKKRSTKESGVVCFTKCLAYRAARRAGYDSKPSGYHYMTKLRVDPTAELGYAVMPEARKPPFSH